MEEEQILKHRKVSRKSGFSLSTHSQLLALLKAAVLKLGVAKFQKRVAKR